MVVVCFFVLVSLCSIPDLSSQPVPPAVEAWYSNHWTAERVPDDYFFFEELIRMLVFLKHEPIACWFQERPLPCSLQRTGGVGRDAW